MTTLERFMAKVEKGHDPDDCWEWTGGHFGRGGYAAFGGKRVNGRLITIGAHRWAYEFFVGPIPDGMQVLHSCDNKNCVNPAHLGVGTTHENNREAVERGRIVSGDDHYMRRGYGKLTREKVEILREEYANGGITHEELAIKYGVARPTITEIINRRRWT